MLQFLCSLQDTKHFITKTNTKMDAIQKVELAIKEVKNNPKYAKNRKGLISFLEARLLQVIYS